MEPLARASDDYSMDEMGVSLQWSDKCCMKVGAVGQKQPESNLKIKNCDENIGTESKDHNE